MSYFNTTQISFADSESVDAFGRLRVSISETQFDAQNQYGLNPLLGQAVLSGGGTVTSLANSASVAMNVGTTSGDSAITQTYKYFRYIPGKSQTIIRSGVLGAIKPNLRCRLGYFDAQNGLFVENNGVDFGVVQRSSVSGTVVDTRVSQSNFNLDKLDGTGPSGITLDTSKNNIYHIDFEWLGAGRVRFSIFSPTSGQPIPFHAFYNANSMTVPYMATANLPLRTEITNIGTTSSPSTLIQTCSTVTTGGGTHISNGFNFSASNGISPISVTTRRPILSVRPKALFNSLINRSTIDMMTVSVYSDASAFYEIVYNGVLGGTPVWTAVHTNSASEFDTASTTISGGVILSSGYTAVGSKSVTSITENILNKLPLTLDINGANPQNISIVSTSFSGIANISASLSWAEIY